MRFCVQLPTENVQAPAEFATAEAIADLARAAEAAGFDAAYVTDHPFPPDAWLAAGGHHTLDPFVALAFAAAATTRLRLLTNILVLPYRNPFLVAKAVATLDVASGGRVLVGTGAGYLEGEFRALGADFAARNEVADEALVAMKRAWTDAGVRLAGRAFEADGHTALPRPVQRPHPPLWAGGNSRRAIRRAVELADGWLPFPTPRRLAAAIRTAAIRSLDDLAARIAYAREHAAAVGRTAPLDIAFIPFGFEMGSDGTFDAEATRAQIAELERLGVTWIVLNVPCASRDEYRDRVATLGGALISG